MDLILVRKQYRSDGIFSDLINHMGLPIAVTLEHAYMNPNGWTAKIPPGTYQCIRGYHLLAGKRKKGFVTYEITGVPGHTKILFHPGNYNKDSEGCVLLGEHVMIVQTDQLAIANSQTTFEHFMTLQQGVDTFTLTVY